MSDADTVESSVLPSMEQVNELPTALKSVVDARWPAAGSKENLLKGHLAKWLMTQPGWNVHVAQVGTWNSSHSCNVRY